jgi:iron complex outermembrane receptor protein
LRGAVAFDDTKYSGGNIACTTYETTTLTCPNNPVAGYESINGQQAIESPRLKYSLNVDYASKIPGSDVGYSANVDWTWQSRVYYELGDDPLSSQGAYGLLNASVGLQGKQWELQLFAKNLTNKLYFSYMNNIAILGMPIGYFSRDFQRYGGLRVTYHF